MFLLVGANAHSAGPLTVTEADEHSGSCPFFKLIVSLNCCRQNYIEV